MAATYSLTPLAIYRSAARDTLVSVAAGGAEVLTLVHRLGACPTEIRFALRSVAVGASAILPGFCIRALNASQAIVDVGTAANPATTVNVDIIAEVTHSLVS